MTIFKNLLFLSILIFVSCSENQTEHEKIEEAENQNEQLDEEIGGDLEQRLIDQGLVDIKEIDSSIKVELKYSTTDNFFKQDVYGQLTKAYLQKDVAERIKKVNQKLKAQFPELTLLIYDGVRPLEVQSILWNSLDSIPAETRKAYVADPEEGSVHNYGCAVDLTIFNVLKDTTLDMGTAYDYFGPLAYPRKESQMLSSGNLSQTQVDNRILLRNVMKSEGFIPITSEWWHFNCTTLANAKTQYKIVN